MEKKYYSAESLGRTLLSFERHYGLSSDAFYANVMAETPMDVPRFDRSVWASVYRDYCRLSGDDFAAQVTRTLELV